MSLSFSTLTPAPVASSGTASSTPAPVHQPRPGDASPGPLGFMVVFLVAIATWLLLRNMTGRLRRMKLRGQDSHVDPQD